MEDDADNLGEIETMQFSDDECCWDDRPSGRRGASRPLVDVFFDQPVLSHSRTIIGPLRLLGGGPSTAGDDLEDSLGTDDDDDVDDYDNDVDDEKRQPEMNTTATRLTERRYGDSRRRMARLETRRTTEVLAGLFILQDRI